MSSTASPLAATAARVRDKYADSPAWVRLGAGIVAVLILVAAMVVLVAPIAFATGDDDKDKKDYSMYRLASNAATYFSHSISPENDFKGPDHDKWDAVLKSPASAGSMLGYADDGNFVSWLLSGISGSSQTVKYEALLEMSTNAGISGNGLANYALFGGAVNGIGLDNMTGGGLDPFLRFIMGGLMWLLFALAVFVTGAFGMVIDILQLINPFYWFHEGLRAIDGFEKYADGMVTAKDSTGRMVVGEAPAAFDGLIAGITKWYGVLTDFSWTILVPMFIGFLLIALILFKNLNRGSAIKKLVVRVLFIGLGLPLFGSAYTGILAQFSSDNADMTSGPIKVVTSTYVDFESWVMDDRLYVPEDATIEWDTENGRPSDAAIVSARNTALAINAQTGKYGVTADEKLATSDGNVTDYSPNLKENLGVDGVGATINLLNRYIGSNVVFSSDFETKIQSTVSSITKAGAEEKRKWFRGGGVYEDWQDFGHSGEGDTTPAQHPIISVSGGGLYTGQGAEAHIVKYDSTGTVHCRFQVVVDPASNAAPADCNLSPLATYNYLNTEFKGDSLQIYSANRVSSGLTRSFHSSVAQVGSGLGGFMYWLNAVALLMSIVVIAISFAFGMLTNAIKRVFTMVAAIPLATLGSMAAIAKFIIYVTAAILEILVTIFLFKFVTEFILALPQIVEVPMGAVIASEGLKGFGPVLSVVFAFLSTILIVMVTGVLIKMRKTVLKAIDEGVTKMVDKFLETNTAPPRQSGGGGGMMPALAGGAGMAATNRMMGGNPKTPSSGGSSRSAQDASARSRNAGGTSGELPGVQQRNGAALDSSSSQSTSTMTADGQGSPGVGGSANSGSGNSNSTSSRNQNSESGSIMSSSSRINRSSSSFDDRQLEAKVKGQGGLSRLGFHTPSRASQPSTPTSTTRTSAAQRPSSSGVSQTSASAPPLASAPAAPPARVAPAAPSAPAKRPPTPPPAPTRKSIDIKKQRKR